jgi:hypothetical protein
LRNNPIATTLRRSVVIAFFAEHSTPLPSRTILLSQRMIARRRGIPVGRSQ